MFRTDSDTSVEVMPTPAAVGVNPNGYYIKGNPSIGLKGTRVLTDALNAIQEEVCNVIEDTGATLSKVDRTQLYTAINELISIGPVLPGISAIVEDTSPVAGGNWDVGLYKIVSASNGDIPIAPNGTGVINLNADVVIKQDLVHRGNTDTYFRLSTGVHQFVSGGINCADLSSAGLRLGGANKRVVSILDEDSMATNSDTMLVTQGAAKAYIDAAFASIDDRQPLIFTLNGILDSYITSSNTNVLDNCCFGSYVNTAFTGVPSPAQDLAVVPRDGTFSKLYVCKTADSVYENAGLNWTCTLMVNGTLTALTCNINKGASGFLGSDLTHSVNVNAGDKVCLIITTQTTTGAPAGTINSQGAWSVLFS